MLCVAIGFGVFLIKTSPTHIVIVRNFSRCYAPPPVPQPCDRIVYSGGTLNVVFAAVCGVMLFGLAAWLLWELWTAVEPKPITDDFLRLLSDSFGFNWRNPLTWPWGRMLWAYGFTVVGVVLAAGIAAIIWTRVASSGPARVPTVEVETSQRFTVGR
jgi:hypothetical protein